MLYKGGIEDFGNFSEGFCFKIKTEGSENSVWIICTSSLEEKRKLMFSIKKIKYKQQRDKGNIVMSNNNKKISALDNYLHPDLAIKQKNESNNSKSEDGYWVTIQDWSQCSLKCGGGKTILHRMCVPPIGRGKPCEGQGIISKICNSNPCPLFSKLNGAITQSETQVLKPTIKVMTFSNRPQQYSKCIIKESDLLYTKYEENNNSNVQSTIDKEYNMTTLPVRVVMNNKTFSIFAGENYKLLKDSFDLKETLLVPYKRDPYCFILRDSIKKARLCLFGVERTKDIYNQWDYDFNLFKYQCNTKREEIKLSNSDLIEVDQNIEKIKDKFLIDHEIELLRRNKEEELESEHNILIDSNKSALIAIQKQVNIEAMIEKEERDREDKEVESLSNEIEKEKKKQESAFMKIKEKEIESQYNIQAEEINEETEELKQKAAQEIIDKRDKLKDKLLQMRKNAERRKSKLKEELRNMRLKFSKEMQKAYKKGSQDNCFSVLQNESNFRFYCLRMFPNEPESYGKCITSDDPCKTCCENEFTVMFINERIKCIKEVCVRNKHKNKDQWDWESANNQK